MRSHALNLSFSLFLLRGVVTAFVSTIGTPPVGFARFCGGSGCFLYIVGAADCSVVGLGGRVVAIVFLPSTGGSRVVVQTRFVG